MFNIMIHNHVVKSFLLSILVYFILLYDKLSFKPTYQVL